jgi:hypothetical protein
MPRVHDKLSGWHRISGRDVQAIFCRSRHQPSSPALACITAHGRKCQPCNRVKQFCLHCESPSSQATCSRYENLFHKTTRQLRFFGQTCALLDKLSDKRRFDLRVNEYTA